MLFSIVIPVYNSAQSLLELYERIKKVMENNGIEFEIIMVDDQSRDESYQVMKKLREQDKRVKIIKLACNAGQHSATLCGIRYAKGDYVITMDDDLQQLPEEIPRLFDKIKEGYYDVVFGIPYAKKHRFYRNWGSKLIDKCLNLIYDKPPDLKVSSFRIMHREMALKLAKTNRENIYLAALILKNTSHIANQEVKHDRRKYGASNYNLRKSFRLALDLLFNYSDLPFKVISFLWIIFFILISVFLVSFFILYPSAFSYDIILAFMVWFFVFLGTLSSWAGFEYAKCWLREVDGDGMPYKISELDL